MTVREHRKWTPMTTQGIRDIRRMTAEGMTIHQIAAVTGWSRYTVHKYRTDLNIKRLTERDRRIHAETLAGPKADEYRRKKQVAAKLRVAEKHARLAEQFGEEPFYVVEATNSKRDLQTWVEGHVQIAKSRGATFSRASYHPEHKKRFLFEAWFKRPEDQGPLRWKEKAK